MLCICVFMQFLRIKRSVQAKFNTEVSYISAQLMAGKEKDADKGNAAADDNGDTEADEGEQAETNQIAGFVRAKETEAKPTEPKAPENPDEIEIDEMESEEDDEEEDKVVERKEVPEGVFGGLKSSS